MLAAPVVLWPCSSVLLDGLSSGHSGQPSLPYLLCPSLQTLYSVRAEILPASGAEFCKTGSLCSLEVCITRLADLLDVDKDEALVESEDYFSTKLMYEGRTHALPPNEVWHPRGECLPIGSQ